MRAHSFSVEPVVRTSSIKTALSFAGWMQRHWNNNVESAAAQPRIVKCGGEPARHQMTEVDLAPVLKIMDDLANDSATAIRRNSSVKMNRAMSAVRANERAGNCAFERFGAFPAKGRDNARGLLLAFCA